MKNVEEICRRLNLRPEYKAWPDFRFVETFLRKNGDKGSILLFVERFPKSDTFHTVRVGADSNEEKVNVMNPEFPTALLEAYPWREFKRAYWGTLFLTPPETLKI